ncbi:MAG: urea carboxylase [Verrucomicrobia bacterium]|nr:urea carboxylase [Verrucomicrobiota bacterium]MCH8514207.1 urea carboxylase [Kiritimatiellia bacterium]
MTVAGPVLIANRGAIACRVIRTLRQMGIPSVAVYSDVDHGSLHVGQADQAICLGPAPASQSYLDVEKILAACRATGAVAVHPGYGFLSENAAFAEQLEAENIRFLGPTPAQMRAFGLKHEAKALAEAAGVPLLPGTGLLAHVEEAVKAAEAIGWPVMLKSTAGGGGIGMKICENAAELRDQYEAVSRLASSNFSDAGVFLEKYVVRARHIEVQIFGDGQGRVVTLGERDCSVQRRHQKVIEETPAPNLTDETREMLSQAARALGESVNYRSAGTVEFVCDADTGAVYFLEVNTRLQVEHGVTEEIYGVDLVEWMVRLAFGDEAMMDRALQPCGHSIQARIYAEDPHKNFQPSSGLLIEASFPANVRVETWVERGTVVPSDYDPMLAKIIARGESRAAALARLHGALGSCEISGIETNLEFLSEILESDPFRSGEATTRMLEGFPYVAHCMDVLDGGAMTTVQDYPGRVGHWDVGVPPSGPMDDASLRLANHLVGNPEGAAAIEITLSGPTLKFNVDTVIALTGARIECDLPMDRPVAVKKGQVLRLKRVMETGCRSYLAVYGGIRCPEYLGSRATFTLGGFGGPAGRALRAGDVLHLSAGAVPEPEAKALAAPAWSNRWNIRVMYGPHGAPDFFTAKDMDMFFGTDWKVHYNSNPTGIRLVGPKPEWARPDGGEAGLHPSNIHDNAYAIGAVDFTGDMPIILGPDGPSLGGFVCPATIIRGDRWIMGQLRPGDAVRFVPVDEDVARAVEAALDAAVKEGSYPSTLARAPETVTLPETAIIAHLPETEERPSVTYRPQGDKNLLIEYGPIVLDFDLRLRAHGLMQWVKTQNLPGVIELTPGIRSLQIHYDNRILPRRTLVERLQKAEAELGNTLDFEVTSRIVHLPLSWDDPATRLAIEKYTQSVRPDAPWCPSNIEFIRRINGLQEIEEVKRIVYEASYMVLGLGDVYLGAPVATPLDPRHRLVTTKYNPARTWTAENSVGIGGAYMCIYGMEGPGGYQFVGRTLQVWNTFRQTDDFKEEKPWLLRFFDQIRFYPVSAEELLVLRKDFLLGRHKLRIEAETFRLRDYHDFLEKHADEIEAFRTMQRQAFGEERERWKLLPPPPEVEESLSFDVGETELPEGCEGVPSPLSGNLWKMNVQAGQQIRQGEVVAIVEAMKMETNVLAPMNGEVVELRAEQGKAVTAGQALVVMRGEPV